MDVPEKPTEPYDASGLTDDQVRGLTKRQLTFANLTDHQWDVIGDRYDQETHPPEPPREQAPGRIPQPEQVAKVKTLFDWCDTMHDQVRTPQGMSWTEILGRLASLRQFMDWAESRPPINARYCYRIDAPLDPHPEVPDGVPEEWEEGREGPN